MSIEFLKFLKEWNSGKDQFLITTSGSTGNPKKIKLKKKLLIYSAEQTFKELGFNKLTKIYNCIAIDKIGGFMNWVRAVHYKLDIQTVTPNANPMVHLSNSHNFTFVSLVPYQLYSILEDKESMEKLNRFTTILLGGSPINSSYIKAIEDMSPSFFLSYGMTETYSHVALNRMSGEDGIGFRPIGDVQFTLDDKTMLQGTITEEMPLEINDILDWNEDNTFNYIGRRDNIINTGGIKISPEAIERRLIIDNPALNSFFIISSLGDEKLGEKIVLLMESKDEIHLDSLESYEKPKEVFYHCRMARTNNGKLLRKETLEIFLKDHGE
jgi:O-succinylbenzoic acid--CoA ligase